VARFITNQHDLLSEPLKTYIADITDTISEGFSPHWAETIYNYDVHEDVAVDIRLV
jgi:hypothetical protein